MPLSTNAKIVLGAAVGLFLMIGAVIIGMLLSPSIQTLVSKEAAKEHGPPINRPNTVETGPTDQTILRPVQFRRAEFVTNA